MQCFLRHRRGRFFHARGVIGVERALGLFFEERLQDAFLGSRPFIQFWNLVNGTFHFVVTIVALVLLLRRFPARNPRWRAGAARLPPTRMASASARPPANSKTVITRTSAAARETSSIAFTCSRGCPI